MQDAVIYIALAAALIYLGRRFVFKKRSRKNGCDKGCDC